MMVSNEKYVNNDDEENDYLRTLVRNCKEVISKGKEIET
jgi:hypothetical protein